MATPTEIEVSVDASEYSRYETGREKITATVVVTGGAPYSSETVTVDLVKARRNRDAVVATASLSFTSNIDPQEGVVVFDLREIVDQDLINLVRHGKYFVKVTSDSDINITGSSADFDVSIVTVDRLKSDYLFGLDLKATELRYPKFQPSQITGVEITEVSKAHPLGFGNLTYNYHEDPTTNATASIGSGADGTVTVTALGALAGVSGNNVVISVLVPAGTSPLSVNYTSGVLSVSLSVNSGVPVALDNTATLVAAAIDALTDFSATASGTGATALSVAEGPTQFSGGASAFTRLLSWRGGPVVNVSAGGTFILQPALTGPAASLLGVENTNYILARVKSRLLLPTSSTTEAILIDRKQIDDDTLRRFIKESSSWVEEDLLATPVEPTNVVTDVDPTTIQFSTATGLSGPLVQDTDYDKVVSPLTYFLPKSSSWVTIQTPWPQLLRVDNLFGAIANTRVIDIDLEWVEHSEQGGLIQLVPFNQEIAFDYLGLIWVNAIRGAVELPNFWHYNAIVGLRDCPYEVQEIIAKKAAINALIVAGQALRPGLGSISLARDGVSESVSYLNSARYGVFTGTIQAYQDWIDEHSKDLRAKYRGATMVVV